MATQVVPIVAIHEIYSGNKFTGVPSNGDPTNEDLFRGRLQKWIGGTLGGEFQFNESLGGMRIEDVFWSLTTTTTSNVSIYLVDDDDVEYLIDTQNLNGGHYAQRSGGILVPPTFKLRVKSDQNINAATAISSEDTGVTGDGVSADYDIALVHGRVVPGTVSITAGATVTFTDPGSDGILVGTGGGGGSGTINYLTGAVQITMGTPSEFDSVNAVADYDYSHIGRVGIVIGRGWGQPGLSQVPTIGRQSLPGQL